MPPMPRSRRDLLLGALAMGVLLPTAALAVPAAPRRISLRNAHTGDVFDGPYRDSAGPLPDAVGELVHLLRDHRADRTGPLDVGVIDLLADIVAAVAQDRVTVLSAFRTPETNALLAARNLGAAERSQHLLGRALDVTLPARLADAHGAALALKRGGVGWYPRSHFLHIDTGPVRRWESSGAGLDGLFAPGVGRRPPTVAERMRIHRALARRRLQRRTP